MPVRDGARFLGPTLRSVARLQGDFEVVVVDDGSVDETPRLLAATDARFRVLTQPRAGLVAALNRGLEAARGRYVARVDADDLVHPTRLLAQLARARAEDLTVVGTGVRCFPTQRIQSGLRRYERWQNALISHAEMARSRFVESPLVHPSVLFEADAVRAVGGYRAVGWPEDYDLWLRLFETGARFGKVPQTLTFWRDHADRVTRTAAHCGRPALAACRAHFLRRGPLRARPFWMLGAGDDAKRVARALLAEGATLRGWFDRNPRRLGQRMHGAPVCSFAPERVGDAVVLVALGGAGQRATGAATLRAAGLREGDDFWCVA